MTKLSKTEFVLKANKIVKMFENLEVQQAAEIIATITTTIAIESTSDPQRFIDMVTVLLDGAIESAVRVEPGKMTS